MVGNSGIATLLRWAQHPTTTVPVIAESRSRRAAHTLRSGARFTWRSSAARGGSVPS